MGQDIGYQWVYKQWGYINGNHISTVEFPLKHTTSVYSVVATRRYGQNYIHVNDITLTEFTGDFAYGDDYKHAMWLSVGVQQWGFLPSVNKDTTTVFDMPLSVTVVYHFNMQANVQRASNSYLNGHAFVGHNGNASITIGDSDHGSAKWWFAICKAQQWGYATKSATGYAWDMTFNVTFPSTVFTVMFSPRYDEETRTHSVSSFSTSGARFRTDAQSTKVQALWCAIGNQQWGVTDYISGNATRIVQFPLAYTTFSHWVANSRSSSTNESSWCTGGYNGTLTGFTARSNGTEIEWIATGLQQWGRWQSGTYSSVTTATYPIAMRDTNYSVVGVSLAGGANFNQHFAVGALTTTGCRLVSGFNGKDQSSQPCALIICGF